MRYLLDTNVCIEVLRGRNLALKARLATRSLDELALCSVVWAAVRVKLLVASSSSHWLPIHARSRGVEHLRSFRVERDHVDVRPVTC